MDPKMDPKRTPKWIPYGFQIDHKSTINLLQINSKIDFKIDFMLTILKSTSPLGAKLKRLFHHLSGVCSSGLRSLDCLDSLVLGC